MSPIVCDPAKRATIRNSVLSELREQQQLAMEDMRDPETKPHVRAMLMRSYVEVQRQRNAERMRPAPKPVEVPAPGQRRRQRRQASDELEPGAPAPTALPPPPKLEA